MFNLLYRSLQRLTENGSPPFDLALRCIPPSLGSRDRDVHPFDLIEASHERMSRGKWYFWLKTQCHRLEIIALKKNRISGLFT
jgi:hypothetical protein